MTIFIILLILANLFVIIVQRLKIEDLLDIIEEDKELFQQLYDEYEAIKGVIKNEE